MLNKCKIMKIFKLDEFQSLNESKIYQFKIDDSTLEVSCLNRSLYEYYGQPELGDEKVVEDYRYGILTNSYATGSVLGEIEDNKLQCNPNYITVGFDSNLNAFNWSKDRALFKRYENVTFYKNSSINPSKYLLSTNKLTIDPQIINYHGGRFLKLRYGGVDVLCDLFEPKQDLESDSIYNHTPVLWVNSLMDLQKILCTGETKVDNVFSGILYDCQTNDVDFLGAIEICNNLNISVDDLCRRINMWKSGEVPNLRNLKLSKKNIFKFAFGYKAQASADFIMNTWAGNNDYAIEIFKTFGYTKVLVNGVYEGVEFNQNIDIDKLIKTFTIRNKKYANGIQLSMKDFIGKDSSRYRIHLLFDQLS